MKNEGLDNENILANALWQQRCQKCMRRIRITAYGKNLTPDFWCFKMIILSVSTIVNTRWSLGLQVKRQSQINFNAQFVENQEENT